ncbi:MAG: hypothetical protein ACRDCY_11150 [Aeromonas veronii]
MNYQKNHIVTGIIKTLSRTFPDSFNVRWLTGMTCQKCDNARPWSTSQGYGITGKNKKGTPMKVTVHREWVDMKNGMIVY